jgi:isopenicillin-N N-acyltransferase-like protein
MDASPTRRQFLHQAACCGAAAAGLQAPWASADELPKVPDHTLTVIAGKPRERGKSYGQKFKDAIHAFLDKELHKAYAKHSSKEEQLRYAGQCTKAIKEYAPTILDEMEGIAEGTGLRLEDIVNISLHEEIGKGALPKIDHCTALAAGPPDTRDGNVYVGQNWDWMQSVFGLSQMLLWKRSEGPSLLAYSYPGLWVGAGLNSAGIALCWTWGEKMGIKAPRVGIPSYVLLTQMLYQDTLKGALEEARRTKHAGWFCFVLADSKGQIANVDGTPEKLIIETPKGHTARASYACKEILGATPMLGQCRRMYDLLADKKGKLDRVELQSLFADHKEMTKASGEWDGLICKHPGFKRGNAGAGGYTVDSMLFNCSTKEAHVSRGPGCSGRWQTFRFGDK